MSGWVIRFDGLSGDSGQWGPYSPYKVCNHSPRDSEYIAPNFIVSTVPADIATRSYKQTHLWKGLGPFNPIYYKIFLNGTLVMSYGIKYPHSWSTLAQVKTCHLFSAKPLPEPRLIYWPSGTKFMEIWIKIQTFCQKKKIFWKYHLQYGSHYVQASMYQLMLTDPVE